MKKHQKFLALLLTIIMVLSMTTIAFAAENHVYSQAFTDVPDSSSYAEAVNKLAEAGIVKGTGNQKFSPDATVTTAELVTFLGRIDGAQVDSTETWFSGYMAWAKTTGIVDSDVSGTLTVEQVNTALAAYCAAKDLNAVTAASASRGDVVVALNAIYAAVANDVVITHNTQEKARTVITTDGEVDDMDSVIRALLYSNDMDISGIVITSSVYHFAGDVAKGIEPLRWTGTDWIYEMLDAYESVYDNLVAHDSNYPDPSYLRSVTKIGNISNVGEMDEITEGSEFLKDLFLDDDERTLYVQTWGGTNTTARALKSIEEEYKGTDKWEAVQQKIYDKLVIYIILDQDDSYSDYIAVNWPGLQVLNDCGTFWHFAYAWQAHSDELNTTLKADWNLENLVGKGPMMELYALIGDGKIIEGELYEELRGTDDYLEANPNYNRYDFISEGDSPSFLYLIDTGLRSMENPSYGGWGGRFGQVSDAMYQNVVMDYNPYSEQFETQYALTRWLDDFQNDFANRVDWTLTGDDSAVNHAPAVEVLEGIDLSAAPGETVTLTARGTDPDGDHLTYRWWRYFEADTYEDSKPTTETEGSHFFNMTRTPGEDEVIDAISITGADQAQMHFTVPENAKKGDTIHMIVEVQDDGAHTLTRYQRVIITVV